ncbi:MAG: hypothetical protein NW206_17835 [Hyphomonadaceae bacterium]|nr:hypothetical protein [Hyphomonadaceae bacterium]
MNQIDAAICKDCASPVASSFFNSDVIAHETPDEHATQEAFVSNVEDYKNTSSVFPRSAWARVAGVYARARRRSWARRRF